MTVSRAELATPLSLRFDAFGWRPLGRSQAVFDDLDLRIEPGERVLLAGPNGAGKSTLLRAAAGVLGADSAGDLTGRVLVGGQPVGELAARAGLVLQNPYDALVAERVGRDVAFGPENLGLSHADIHRRVDQALALVRFPHHQQTPTHTLSGGETQRLALAGALALRPGLLLLDEPTSMLDTEAATALRAAVLDVVTSTGATLVVAEQRIEPWLGNIGRLVVLDAQGTVRFDGHPADLSSAADAGLLPSGLWVPGLPAPEPLPIPADVAGPRLLPDGERLLCAERLSVTLRTRGLRTSRQSEALSGVDAEILSGTLSAVTGPSGSGKSTLLGALAGLVPPTSGRVCAGPRLTGRAGFAPLRWRSAELAARIGWVPQDPEHGFLTRRVVDEVELTSRRLGWRSDTDRLLDLLGLTELAGSDPYHLSGGEQRRLSLLAALAHLPAVALLDEPTIGQDRNTWRAVAGWLLAVRRTGRGLAVSTHDRALVREVAQRELRLEPVAAGAAQ